MGEDSRCLLEAATLTTGRTPNQLFQGMDGAG